MCGESLWVEMEEVDRVGEGTLTLWWWRSVTLYTNHVNIKTTVISAVQSHCWVYHTPKHFHSPNNDAPFPQDQQCGEKSEKIQMCEQQVKVEFQDSINKTLFMQNSSCTRGKEFLSCNQGMEPGEKKTTFAN